MVAADDVDGEGRSVRPEFDSVGVGVAEAGETEDVTAGGVPVVETGAGAAACCSDEFGRSWWVVGVCSGGLLGLSDGVLEDAGAGDWLVAGVVVPS
ncbi:hypothetical protein [Amycolatopsis sp. NPDC021455]|uniref:hypothetical protein n=1 Tax=Amycolatopsis sp. NPDC021455 TaxID=3154901 RepID=UPI0033FB8868